MQSSSGRNCRPKSSHERLMKYSSPGTSGLSSGGGGGSGESSIGQGSPVVRQKSVFTTGKVRLLLLFWLL